MFIIRRPKTQEDKKSFQERTGVEPKGILAVAAKQEEGWADHPFLYWRNGWWLKPELARVYKTRSAAQAQISVNDLLELGAEIIEVEENVI